MAIFGNIEIESVVQVGDRTRINCVKTFISKDEALMTLVRIKPEASESFIQVSGSPMLNRDFYLDWEYSTPGIKTITLEVTTDGAAQEFTKTLTVISVADDCLYSNDSDLTAIEPDILKWIPTGRNSFLNVHRAAQKLILDWLDSIRVWRKDGSKLQKQDLKYTDDLNQVSIYTTLELIFMGISNKTDDVFLAKAREYRSKAVDVKSRGRIQADFNADNALDSQENVDLKSFTMVRR